MKIFSNKMQSKVRMNRANLIRTKGIKIIEVQKGIINLKLKETLKDLKVKKVLKMSTNLKIKKITNMIMTIQMTTRGLLEDGKPIKDNFHIRFASLLLFSFLFFRLLNSHITYLTTLIIHIFFEKMLPKYLLMC